MTYDPVTYWRERGTRYEAEFVRSPKYDGQEEALLSLLKRLRFRSILEVGCGFGRIGALLNTAYPRIPYTGIELSPDMLASAASRLPDAELIETTLANFDAQGRQWDLVVAVETLMHLRPEGEIEGAVAKMRDLSGRHIVTIDWTYPLDPSIRIARHNFLHDYRALFGPKAKETRLGPDQAMWHVRREVGQW